MRTIYEDFSSPVPRSNAVQSTYPTSYTSALASSNPALALGAAAASCVANRSSTVTPTERHSLQNQLGLPQSNLASGESVRSLDGGSLPFNRRMHRNALNTPTEADVEPGVLDPNVQYRAHAANIAQAAIGRARDREKPPGKVPKTKLLGIFNEVSELTAGTISKIRNYCEVLRQSNEEFSASGYLDDMT